MNEQELIELLKSLEEHGWNPMICDTPVPFFENAVMCGKPNGVGDVVQQDMMMPRAFLAMQPEFFIKAKGDSMTGVDIMENDTVRIETDVSIHDGDIVLVRIDDEFTLKTYCEDDDGTPWLIPQNPKYKAFPLEAGCSVWVVGKATKIMRDTPHTKYSTCKKLISEAKTEMNAQTSISPLQISQTIREVASMIDTRRKWYAVYRAMADVNAVGENDFDTFINMVGEAVPHHASLPTRAELLRIATQSFAKPVVLWRPGNAPVQGKRYNEYVRIAQRTLELLQP